MMRTTTEDYIYCIFITYHWVGVVRYKYKKVQLCMKILYIYILSFMVFYRRIYIFSRIYGLQKCQKNKRKKKTFQVRCVKERSNRFYVLFFFLSFSSPPPVATRQTADSSAMFINTMQTVASFPWSPPVNVVSPWGIWLENSFRTWGIVSRKNMIVTMYGTSGGNCTCNGYRAAIVIFCLFYILYSE